MPRFRIEQKRDECIGCGACVSVCPDNWKMEKDGKAKPKKTIVDDVGCNQEAADVCPVQIIKIVKV